MRFVGEPADLAGAIKPQVLKVRSSSCFSIPRSASTVVAADLRRASSPGSSDRFRSTQLSPDRSVFLPATRFHSRLTYSLLALPHRSGSFAKASLGGQPFFRLMTS
jgi:hypothetical protein